MVSAINYVWNYCNEVSLLAYRRDKTFLSAHDLRKLTADTSKDLCLSADTIQQVCTEYVTRRRQCKKIKLKWRSKKRSLGWIPCPLPWTHSRCPERRRGCGRSRALLRAYGVYWHCKRRLVITRDTDLQSDAHGSHKTPPSMATHATCISRREHSTHRW